MVLMTMIARVADGLPLAATMQEDEQASRFYLDFINYILYNFAVRKKHIGLSKPGEIAFSKIRAPVSSEVYN